MDRFVDADITKVYDLAQVDFPLGAKTFDQSGRLYCFCKYNQGDGAVAGAEGMVVVGLDDAYLEYEVTADVDSAVIFVIRSDCKGIIIPLAVVDGEGFFAQYAGRNIKDMITKGNVTNGDVLKPDVAVDGAVDVWLGTNTLKDFAIALADDTGNVLATGDCRLYCPTVR